MRLRGRFQRQLKRAAHSERLLTNPANTTPKGKSHVLAGKTMSSMTTMSSDVSIAAHGNLLSPFSGLLCPSSDVDGNDLMSYWPALGECEVHPCSLQKWGSERKLGFDVNKDAANNNQPDLALTSGDENSLTQTQRQRKGNNLEQAGKGGLVCVRLT